MISAEFITETSILKKYGVPCIAPVLVDVNTRDGKINANAIKTYYILTSCYVVANVLCDSIWMVESWRGTIGTSLG